VNEFRDDISDIRASKLSAGWLELVREQGGMVWTDARLAGNPFEGYWNFLNPKLVVKGGVVVSDHR